MDIDCFDAAACAMVQRYDVCNDQTTAKLNLRHRTCMNANFMVVDQYCIWVCPISMITEASAPLMFHLNFCINFQ